MEIPELLQTIAEIGIGLAGFSGLIVALRRRKGPFDEIQRYRMNLLFALAFGAMLISLLPELLDSFGVPADRIWFDSSAALATYTVLLLWWWISGAVRHARVVPEIFNWYAFTSMSIGHFIMLMLQFGVMAGFIVERAPGAFAAGLVWYLIHAAQQFVRMLYIHPRDSAEHG